MFANHTSAKKRARDDDSDSDFDDERYVKKSRPEFSDHRKHSRIQCLSPTTLPHRPSLTPSPPRIITHIEVMTPAQSEYGGPNSPESVHDESFSQSTQPNYMDYNMDMDDDDMEIRSQPPESPALSSFGSLLMRPAMLNSSLFMSDSVNNSGRIPTPIYPTFKRGGAAGLNYTTTGLGGLSEERVGVPVLSIPASLSRKSQRQEMDEDRNRRIPSPISEDEDIPDTPTAFTQSQLSRLSFSHANIDLMETEVSAATPVVPPTPRGRKRSGALTGMGRFSMGYREDCEKCRQRVPGHYSHFLP